MKFNILKTRKGKLEEKIRLELELKNPNIQVILKAIDDYELDNLMTIEKLRKEKAVDTKKINGALRQTIKAHGPITMLLIGSATKRIYGSLITNVKPNTLLERIKAWMK